ncbi:hypothetical protein HY948_04965 [Candidatus Gottesmanbacteria bacterium]|nr:hypothetical protein [Candidatus Gottesmanbacteria bacterium]
MQRVYAKTLEYTEGGVATIRSFETLFTNLVTAIVSIAGIALFIMLLVGGFKFLFSAGDQKQLEEARGTITSAIIGLVVIVAAYLILRTVATFTGVTGITNFNLNIQ